MLRLALFLGVLTGGGWFSLDRIERAMVYPFDATRISPAAAGLPHVTEREIKRGGETLVVWLAAPAPGQPTILYFHGNAGNLANRAERFALLTARGYGLVAPAYRGSSGSSGKPVENALSGDARAIYNSLSGLIPGLTAGAVILYGESLGTGVALKLAARSPKNPPRAVVLEAPYTSLPDVARDAMPKLRPVIPLMKNRWNSLRHIVRLKSPLFVLHGTRDDVIPIEMGRQLFAAAPSEDKTFLEIPGAGHNDTWRDDVLPVLWRFIDDRTR